MDTLSKFKSVKTFVFDMDGVLTDGKLWIVSGTDWIRNMHIRDGYALKYAVDKGYKVIIISGSKSSQVKKRLYLLGISDVYMDVQDKKQKLLKCLDKYKLDINETLFMGDDIPDYDCMKIVGLPSCPEDACMDIKKVSIYVSSYKGGEGCVRDVIEKVMKLNGHWELD